MNSDVKFDIVMSYVDADKEDETRYQMICGHLIAFLKYAVICLVTVTSKWDGMLDVCKLKNNGSSAYGLALVLWKKQTLSVIIIFILNAKEGNKIYVINLSIDEIFKKYTSY